MSGDFSRFTFDPQKNYSKVLMQQGRVILDADWNEMQSIISNQTQHLVNDLVGDVAYPTNDPAFTPQVRGGLRFDGKKDFVLIDNQGMNFSWHQHFSIIASLTLSQTGQNAVILSQWSTLTQYGIETGMTFGVSAEGLLYLQRTIATDTRVEVETLSADSAIPFDTELQLAVTYNGSSIRLYVNAKEVLCEFEPQLGVLEAGTITIGAWLEGRLPSRNMKACLYDMAIYSRALALNELSFNAFSHRQIDEMGLQAWWPFTEGEGESSRDISGHGHHGLLGAGVSENTPTWLPSRLSFSPGRVYVDGVIAEQCQGVDFLINEQDNGCFMTYLDMQQRLISAIDDPSLLEPGLMGVDTSVRVQTQLVMRRFPDVSTFDNLEALAQAWTMFQAARERVGQIKVNTLPKRAPFKSTLYRVQIVEDVDLAIKKTLPVVWSSDNSALAYRVTQSAHQSLHVQGLERRDRQLISGSYFSLLDSGGHEVHSADSLLRVTEIDLAQGIVSYSGELNSTATPVKLMHWQTTIIPIKLDDAGMSLNIDDRLQLGFKLDTLYCRGDYWLIPTRAAQDTLAVKENVWLSPFEKRSFHQSVAAFERQEGTLWLQKDWRKAFMSAVQWRQFLRQSGGVMTGPLTLKKTLRVEGDAQFDGNVILKGELSSQSIGSEQLKDHSVTHHKLAQNVGLHLGQCVLSQHETPLPGYVKVGNIIGDTEHATWQSSEYTLPLTGPFFAHNLGQRVILLYGSGEVFEVIQKENSVIDFDEKASFPGEVVRQFATCVLDGDLYVAGGKNAEGQKSQQCYCYDLLSDRWEKKADLIHPTSHMALASWDGKIYGIGGMQTRLLGLLQHSPSRHLWCYDPEFNRWKSLMPMPDDRYSGGAVMVNGLLHYIGGSDRELSGLLSESFCNTHFVYHPKEDRWQQALPIPLARSRFGIFALNDKIYCLGGRTGKGYTANVQVYNPETDYWEAEASLNVPRSHVVPVLLHEVIYALGGKREEQYTDFIENQNDSTEFFVHRLERYLE
ncbi:DUF6519 domain-containing protein [uncultured Shewanella sp.]|uniref:DUF6519 domain-containing protein n=1 Tax=uncultured Shewanella sp. TaxID=173975 RepID=UPI002634A530|nr:DUF6519 domain-containing protein [uncultured Shewanella sp.]